jgi:hypothetical protein
MWERDGVERGEDLCQAVNSEDAPCGSVATATVTVPFAAIPGTVPGTSTIPGVLESSVRYCREHAEAARTFREATIAYDE